MKFMNLTSNNWWRPESQQVVTCAGILWR